MKTTTEINRRYIPAPSTILDSEPALPETASVVVSVPKSHSRVRSLVYDSPLRIVLFPLWSAFCRLRRYLSSVHDSTIDQVSKIRNRLQEVLPDVVRVLLVPVVFAFAFILTLYLQICLLGKRKKIDSFTEEAAKHVSEFAEQYTFHLYHLIAKSFELAFIEQHFDRFLVSESPVLEIAIGEGSFSHRIFKGKQNVVGLDIAPTSLDKAAVMNHVRKAVICDCLSPPILSGTFESLLANNFLHHVTDKSTTLKNWSKLARFALFNENTPYWASSWAVPRTQAILGLKELSADSSAKIEQENWQCLRTKREIDSLVRESYDVLSERSFLSQKTFFLCTVFSFLLRKAGPPTPPVLKSLFLGPLRKIALPTIVRLAKHLICFDQFQDREKDTFVSYAGLSRNFKMRDGSEYLACPNCGAGLASAQHCPSCGKIYPTRNKMLFLLPEGLMHICDDYNEEVGRRTPAEHL